MTIIEIDTFLQLISELQKDEYKCGHVIFRGVKDKVNHKLVPSVGRLKEFENLDLSKLQERETTMLSYFKQRAYGDLAKIPTNDWIWLALAQHHGLPTRLLD